MIELRGAGGAPGIAIGPLVKYESAPSTYSGSFPLRRERAVAYLRSLGDRLRARGMRDEAAIFDAQALLAADPAIEQPVERHVAAGKALDDAIRAAIAELAASLEALGDAYLAARAADMRAVGAALLGGVGRHAQMPRGAIVLAADLTPAETVDLPLEEIGGLATAAGSPTSHTAILARSLGIPAVVGLGDAALRLNGAAQAILDGDRGRLIVDPDAPTRRRYTHLAANRQVESAEVAALAKLPAETKDGRRIALWANIGGPADVPAALRAGAEGIGLLRTEFLFAHRSAPPSEDEQITAYRAVLDGMQGRPVVVRTLDAGGDKPLAYLPRLSEPNPFLGERGIRFSQRFPELFRTQLRALLRAAAHGDLRIMLPMIATAADLAWARAELDAVRDSLRSEDVMFRADAPLGIMIETPAAAVMADALAAEVDFFSIGSNDLAQYALAVDRTLAPLAGRYSSADPAVYRLIAMAIAGAQTANIPVSVCGEVAGDPEAAIALLGLGVDELSMAPASIGVVKARIRALSFAEAEVAGRRAKGVDNE